MSPVMHRLGATVVALAASISFLPAHVASARADPNVETVPSSSCVLERVGTQFVRCDNLTGNGVPAPSWIPEQ